MENKYYNKQEAYKLNRMQQKQLLELREVKYPKYAVEAELVHLILLSNPNLDGSKKDKPKPKDDGFYVSIELRADELESFDKILEIAGSGIPDNTVKKLVKDLQEKLN